MEYESRWVCTTFTTTSMLLLLPLIFGATFADRGKVHMVISPDSVVVPIDDGTSLSCEMNLPPDRFQWRFYPLGPRLASNPKAPIYLAQNNSIELPSDMFTHEKKSSKLHIKVDSTEVAGDYQCLAYYGASVVASVPGRLTITSFEDFPRQEKFHVTVVAGNTVSLRCDPPYSNPPAALDYYKNGNIVRPPVFDRLSNNLIVTKATPGDSGRYTCTASNVITKSVSQSGFTWNLKVVNSAPREAPKFVSVPKKSYTVIAGETAFLECSAVGNPVPVVTWQKEGGLLPDSRAQMVPGGLKINNANSTDDGIYVCSISNNEGNLVHKITLIYNEAPTVISGPSGADIKEGENLERGCEVRGTPEPIISWFLNGRSVKNDSYIEAIGNKIYINPVEKRHAGILQCFATNVVGTVYSASNIIVIPKQVSSLDPVDEYPHIAPTAPAHRKKKPKHPKRPKHRNHKTTAEMIPPSKPNVSRLNDEAVMVRWSVPPNNGLPIQFFKVQYRELGPTSTANGTIATKGSRWKTTNADIPPHIRSYEVNNLKADHIYKFRIAAVYSNNDNKLGPNSAKFHLIRQDFYARNPLPVPKLTHTETVNSTSIRIYWEYATLSNVTTDGFFINYQSASSAGDYTKATVDGEKTRSYVITHLQPDTFYDIKIQSFNTRTASDFSPILKQRTARVPTEAPPSTEVAPGTGATNASGDLTNLYIYIGAGVVGIAALTVLVLLLVICKKRKEKGGNGSNGRDGDHVDKHSVVMEDGGAHHIQADGNGYIVSPKTVARANGCGPQPNNRITITANPLAEADKTQNMIEMSCLSSQNNNCSVTNQQQQPSSASEVDSGSNNGSTSNSLPKSKLKQREKHKRGGKVPPTSSAAAAIAAAAPAAASDRGAGENYV